MPGARVIVPGGPVEPDTLALYGSQVVDAVRDISADVMLLGACSISAAHGLTSATYEDAQLKRASIQAASKTILVATGAKLNQTSNFRFSDAADLAHLVTTADAPGEVLAAFEADGVPVTLTSAGLFRRAASPAAGKEARQEPPSWQRTGVSCRPAPAGLRTGTTPNTAREHRAGPMSRGAAIHAH